MKTNAAMRELSTAHGSRTLRRRLLPALVAGCFSMQAMANPLGPQVVSGQAGFSSQGNLLSITNTPGAIINWQSFSINPGEITRFLQQNSNSAVLNRIVGQDPSQILGALQSNGRVFLINPNGILFGQGAQVDVNGLVGSTLNISNEDFINGKMRFKAGDKAGNIRNQGAIATPAGGQVMLIAPNVENSGIITSPKGEVMLAAGHSVQLVDTANPDLQVVVSAPDSEALNLGQIIAQGGRTGIYGALIKQRGIVSADSAVVGENGKIVFKASGDALLEAGSRTTATGAGGGGEIAVLGERVGLFDDAQVDASGQQGGGTVLIGGDYQGTNTAVQNAKATYVGVDAAIRADAGQSGDGGKVIVWSDDSTKAYGSISARGGEQSGNGGLIETSGHFLDVTGLRINARSPTGMGGTWLLDPYDVTLSNSSNSNVTEAPPNTFTATATSSNVCVSGANCSVTGIAPVLEAGTSVTIKTDGNTAGLGAGNITVVDPIAWTTGATLSLDAYNGIAVNNTISAASGILRMDAANGDITQSASIQVSQMLANANGGSVQLSNASNDIGTLSGYSNGTSGFNYTDSNGLIIGTVLASNGVRANNKPISITVAAGNLDIADSNYGVDAGTANISLMATAGTVLESGGGKITGNSLTVSAGSVIDLATATNAVNTLSASQTTTGGTNIAFVNNAPLSVASVNQASLATSTVSISTTNANNISLTGPVTVGSSLATLSVKAGTSGTITRSGSGLLTANTISLQSDSSGALGVSGTPLLTSTIGGSGNANITIGATSGPGSVYLSHTGDATLSTVTLSANAPVEISATGDLTATSISAGTGSLSLASGDLLTIPATKTLSATGITMAADRIALANSAGANDAGTGVLWLAPKTASWDIDLGASATDVAANTLELSTAELNTLAGSGTLKIGALTAGNLHISAAIAPSNHTGAMMLEAGGNITQVGAGIITRTDLAIETQGDVTLNTAENLVTNLAGSIVNNQNKNFLFKNGQSLNIGAGIAGKTGISLNLDATGFNSASPNGVISLQTTATSALTQSATATLGGKAVYAEGGKVLLTESNPTGVIAGKSTGTLLATDVFSYTSFNGIAVTDIAAFSGFATASGIQHAGPADAASIQLGAGAMGISQSTGALITSANSGGLKLVTSGAVNLNSANSVGRLTTGANTGALNFNNAGNLTLGITEGDGITTSAANQSVNITSGGLLIVEKALNAGTGNVSLQGQNVQVGKAGVAGTTINGGFIKLKANPGAISSDGASPSTVTGSLGIELEADSISWASGITFSATTNGIAYRPVTDNLAFSTSPIFNNATYDSMYLAIGNEVASETNTAGNITVDAAIDRTNKGLALLSGGSVTQSQPITALNLGIDAASVTLDVAAGNQVTNLAGKTGGGNFSFKNAGALNVATFSGTLPDGAYSVSGINAGTGNVTLSAGGAISGGTITGNNLSLTGGGVISLTTLVSSLDATNSLVDTNISISNSSSSALTLNNVLNNVNTPSTGGITVTNSGALTVAGTVSTDSGGIFLQAGTNGGSGGVLNISGSVSSNTGTIHLMAGDAINGDANAITSGSKILSAGQNNPAPATPTAPTISQCTENPTLSGCSTVLPTLDSCTTTPTLTGCTAVLPTLDSCTTTPTLTGCTAVLPTLDSCTTTPTLTGCTAVLPTLDSCTTTPTLTGCTAVLPTLDSCTTTPTLAGCAVVLPTLNSCTTTPTLTGCTAVLPTVSACTGTPTLAGCTAVLPTLNDCTTSPSLPGCVAVLPTLSNCTASPTLVGCTAVLPTVNTCTSTPSLEGCSAVLPTLDACTASPTLAGCSAILPALSACSATPTLSGCIAVLPTLTQCSVNPNQDGCAVVVPAASKCVTNPSLPECQTVLPTTETTTTAKETITETVTTTVNTVVTATVSTQASTTTVQTGSGASSGTGGGSSQRSGKTAEKTTEKTSEKSDDKKDEKKTTSGPEDSGAKKNEPAKKMYCN